MRKGLILLFAILSITLSIGLFAEDDGYVIINKTDVVIHELYLSAHTTNNWEENLMADDTLDPDTELGIEFDPDDEECIWDLMVVDGDGNKLYWESIDLCEYTRITLHFKDGKGWAEFE
jgi:hypothetical protein